MATRSRLKNMAMARSESKSSMEPKPLSKASELEHFLSTQPKSVSERTAKQGLASDTESYYQKWRENDQRSKRVAEQERLAAERVLAETSTLLKETSRDLREVSKETCSKIHQRLNDITFWREELELTAKNVDNERDRLEALESRLKAQLENVCQPLMETSEQCLAHRRQRLSDDRIDDSVQKHLKLELDTCKQVRIVLKQSLVEIGEQRRILTKSLVALESDLRDKTKAIDIDQSTDKLRLIDNFRQDNTKGGIMKSRVSSSVEGWQMRSEKLLESSKIAIERSTRLHSLMDALLSKVGSQLMRQKQLTDNAFERRLSELFGSKKELEQELSETEIKIRELEESLETLEKALESKRGPLQLCQMRIERRKQRPYLELVKDEVELNLENEKKTLINVVERIEQQLRINNKTLVNLKQARLELKSNVDVRNQSVYVDDVLCRNIRRAIAINSY